VNLSCRPRVFAGFQRVSTIGGTLAVWSDPLYSYCFWVGGVSPFCAVVNEQYSSKAGWLFRSHETIQDPLETRMRKPVRLT
jgi:hypothetical protein